MKTPNSLTDYGMLMPAVVYSFLQLPIWVACLWTVWLIIGMYSMLILIPLSSKTDFMTRIFTAVCSGFGVFLLPISLAVKGCDSHYQEA